MNQTMCYWYVSQRLCMQRLIFRVVQSIRFSVSSPLFVARNSKLAYTKKMIAKIQSMPLEEGLDFAANMNAKARESVDCKKGIASFSAAAMQSLFITYYVSMYFKMYNLSSSWFYIGEIL